MTNRASRCLPTGVPVASVLAVFLTVCAAILTAEEPSATPKDPAATTRTDTDALREPDEKLPKARRIREGTRLMERPGRFIPSGERYLFVLADTGQRMVVLENLALQRIAQTSGDGANSLTWTVTGLVTEFRGGNCLLVTRAILSSTEP